MTHRIRRLLPVLLGLTLLATGCPKRVVIVGGVEMDYDTAAAKAFDSAKEAYLARRYDDAVAGFTAYLAKFDKADQVDQARFYLAKSYEALGKTEQARQTYATLLEKNPLSSLAPKARLALGLDHLELGEFNDAIQVLRPAYDSLSGDDRAKAASALSDAAVGLEDWTQAVKWIGEVRALATNPEKQKEADDQLLSLIDGKVPAVGLAKLEQDLDKGSPAYPLVVLKLAKVHYHLGEYAQAAAAVHTYLTNWPEGRFAAEAKALSGRLDELGQVKPKVIGLILPLSGDYKVFGEAVMRGISMALDPERGTGGGDITIVIRDSKGDPRVASKAVEDLVLKEHVIAIIGPLLSSTASAAAAKAEELAVPMISVSSAEGLPDLGAWIFRNALTNSSQAEALVDYAVHDLGAKTFGILYPNHAYGMAMMDDFWTDVEKRHLEVRAAERYDHDQTTFGPTIKKMDGRYYLQFRPEYQQQIDQIKATITDPYRRRKAIEKATDAIEPTTDFDVLFIPDSYKTVSLIAPALAVEDIITNVCDDRDMARIKKTTGEKKLHTVRLLGSNVWNNPELVQRAGKYVDCSIFVDGFFPDSKRQATQSFVTQYRNLHGKDKTPSYLEAIGFDTAGIVRKVLDGQNPQGRMAFRQDLLAVRDFPGATGDTSFGANGDAKKPLFFLTVEKGQITEVEPGGAAGD